MGGDEYDAFDEATREDIAHLLWMRRLDAAQVPAEIAAQLTSAKNSPAAAGERMRRFLSHLIEHPVAHTRDETKVYASILPHCRTLSPLQTYALRGLLPRSASEGYEPLPEPIELQFPRDHALHPRAQVGWHFFVGSCWDEHGQEYGIELMFFGGATFPPALAAEYGLSDLENQMIELQLAISVAGERHHQAQPLVTAGTSGLLQASDRPFMLAVGRNRLQALHADELFPLRVQAWGLDAGHDPALELEIDMLFSSGKECLLQGADGAMPALDGIGTIYYSIPNIQLDPARSRLRIGDREVKLQRGLFWFDHQWGSLGMYRSEAVRAADNVGEPGPEGWDWFEAHFSADRQLTVFAPLKREHARDFYDQTGPEKPGNLQLRVGGKLIDAARQTTTVWGTLRITDWIKAGSSPNPDRYSPTQVWHPNRWEFTFDEMPDDIRCFTMTPIVAHGQAAFFANGAQISEGAVYLLDSAGNEIGRGFAESVGYADTRRAMLRLAGLPQTSAMLERVGRRAPPLGTRIKNALYVLSHWKELRERIAAAKGLEFFEDDDAKRKAGG